MNRASTPSREHPLSPELDVEAGRDAYLRENGFTVAAYDAPRTPASLFGIPFSVPNPPRHRWAIMLHDLHHVATGFGTDLIGEGEIRPGSCATACAAWASTSGFSSTGLALLGLLVAPRRTWRAYRLGAGGTSLFRLERDYDELLAMDVGQLRATLGIPLRGLATGPRGLHGRAPKGV